MKKLMNIGSMAVVAALMASPALAEEMKKKTHEVTELVGYEETVEVTVPAKDAAFAKMDTNRDGRIEFNEFRNNTMHDEPYGVFARMDTNRDEWVSIDELRGFSKTKGGGTTSSSRFNFNKPKHYDVN